MEAARGGHARPESAGGEERPHVCEDTRARLRGARNEPEGRYVHVRLYHSIKIVLA